MGPGKKLNDKSMRRKFHNLFIFNAGDKDSYQWKFVSSVTTTEIEIIIALNVATRANCTVSFRNVMLLVPMIMKASVLL